MKLQTKKKKKHVINFITAFMLGCFFLACSGGGGGDDPEPKPQKPSISLNPSDLTFLSSKGDTKNLEIRRMLIGLLCIVVIGFQPRHLVEVET